MATVTATRPIPALPLPSPDAVYRLSVSQFDRMVRDGMLDEDEPVELLNGILVTKMPKNPRHRVGTRKVVRALEGVIPAGLVRSEGRFPHNPALEQVGTGRCRRPW